MKNDTIFVKPEDFIWDSVQREIRAKEYSETVRKARKQEKILFLNFMNNATVIFATLLLIISLIVSG